MTTERFRGNYLLTVHIIEKETHRWTRDGEGERIYNAPFRGARSTYVLTEKDMKYDKYIKSLIEDGTSMNLFRDVEGLHVDEYGTLSYSMYEDRWDDDELYIAHYSAEVKVNGIPLTEDELVRILES